MSAVQRTTLGECCEIVSGATPLTSVADYWDGDIEWVTPKDLSDLDGKLISRTARRITDEGLASCAATVLPPNSVLFSSRAPIGHVAINTVPMATNQGFKSFVPKAKQVDSSFLYYWLRAHRAHLESLGNGATFKEVSKAVVSRVEIELPPLAEQRRIADILDKADAIRRKRKEAIALTEELLRSAFLEMFGDPVTNPMGWPVSSIDELKAAGDYTCVGGPFGSNLTSRDYVETGIPVIRGTNLGAKQNVFVDDDFVFVSEKKADDLIQNMAYPGDVVFTQRGTLGQVAVVPETARYPRYVISQSQMKLTPNNRLISAA